MTDTPPEIIEMQRAIWMAKPLEERVRLGFSMIEEGFEIVKRSIVHQHPTYDAREVTAALFERLYGNEFSLEEKNCIVAYLKNKSA